MHARISSMIKISHLPRLRRTLAMARPLVDGVGVELNGFDEAPPPPPKLTTGAEDPPLANENGVVELLD